MQQRSFLLSLIICALGAASCKHPITEVPGKTDTLLYLMAGQSNMAGRGTVEAMDMQTNPRLLEMDDAFHYSLKSEPNTIYQGGLAGLDCGLSFGNEVLMHLPEQTRLGLIQCSISSTRIQEWLGDSLHAVKLYSNMLRRGKAAMQSGTLKGVLWMQGEGNAEDAQVAAGYDQYLSQFIQNFRRDVGAPSLPFYVGLLPRWCIRPYHDSVNAAIRRTASALPAVYLIETDDLSYKADSLHFDAAGQRELGRRFAAVAISKL